MLYFGYDYNGNEKYRLLGVSDDDGIVYDIMQLLERNISILEQENLVKLELIGNILDIHVLDSDDLLPFNMYKSFESLKNSKKIISVLPIDTYETEDAKKWKMTFNRFITKNKITEASFEDINRMFLQRYKFDKSNIDGVYIKKHPDILMMDNVVNNSEESTVRYIKNILRTLPEYKKRFENRPLTSESQKIFFNATDFSIMPDVEEVAGIDDGTVDVYRLKSMVPVYTNLIGGFVNYRRGSEVGATGSYTGGDYIRSSDTARLLNSTDYKKILSGVTNVSDSAYKQTIIGGRRIDITESYITGDSDYDDDTIRENEIEYFNVLKKFIDDCLEHDIMEAPIIDWRSCGMKTVEHIPDLNIVAHQSFSETSCNTFKMIDKDSDDSFTREKLAEYGINEDSIREECVGTPTANRWFKYAINVALMATRAYTGFVDVPFGYEQCDFDENAEMPWKTIDAKYSAYRSGNLWIGRGCVSAEDYDNRLNSDSEDVTTFDDYYSIDGSTAYDYWHNSKSSKDINEFNRPNLLESVISYCSNSGSFYAMAEALIKCLRFGMKKPRCLKLEGVPSRVDLTTTSLKTEVLRNNPIPLSNVNADKIYVIGKIVVLDHNNISSQLKKSNAFKFSDMNSDIVVGVGLTAKYKQVDGREEIITDYYDLETFIKDKDIHSKIVNFEDGKIIGVADLSVDKIVKESVQDVMSNYVSNSSTTSIVINDNIYSNVINYYLKNVESSDINKAISSINKRGFNFFSLCNHLMKISSIPISIRIIGLGNDIATLSKENNIFSIENFMYVKALTLYGGLFNKLIATDLSGSISDKFNNGYSIWSDVKSYKLNIYVANGSSNEVSSKSYFESLKEKISTDDSYEIGVVSRNNVELFYILQSKKTRKYIALNKDKITISEAYELSRKPVVDGKKRIGKISVGKLISAVELAKKKSGKSLSDVVDKLFIFYDSDTEKMVKNILNNSI